MLHGYWSACETLILAWHCNEFVAVERKTTVGYGEETLACNNRVKIVQEAGADFIVFGRDAGRSADGNAMKKRSKSSGVGAMVHSTENRQKYEAVGMAQDPH
eukprot:Gb_14559 [translate_table: standard]